MSTFTKHQVFSNTTLVAKIKELTMPFEGKAPKNWVGFFDVGGHISAEVEKNFLCFNEQIHSADKIKNLSVGSEIDFWVIVEGNYLSVMFKKFSPMSWKVTEFSEIVEGNIEKWNWAAGIKAEEEKQKRIKNLQDQQKRFKAADDRMSKLGNLKDQLRKV